MKKYYFLIIVVLILGLVLTGCSLLSNVGQVPTTEQSGITYLTKGIPGDPDVFTLYAGQHIDVGTVEVWNDTDNLYVKYVVNDPWRLTETHLHIFFDDMYYIDIPQKNGNPIPGKFDYKGEHDCVTEYTYTIPLNLVPEDELFIAAHAVVADTSSEMTELLVSEPGVAVYGPLDHYALLKSPDWVSSNPAVACWVHPSWPSIPGATWISTAYYVENTVDSWRWFHDEITLPEKGYYIGASVVLATTDNAEEVYLNGEFVGSDGEVQGSFIDNHEWKTIVDYDIAPQPGVNHLDIITRNYGVGGSSTSNPTGLIYQATVNYYPEETAWAVNGEGLGFLGSLPFSGKNWATYFTYNLEEIFIETVIVSPDGEDDCSVAILGIGKKYRLDASGTYRFANWGVAGIADAKYSLRSSVPGSPWTSGDDLPTPWENYLELWVNGSSQAWEDFNPAHTYSMEYDGDESPVCFSIIDSAYGDNSGSLTVDIYWIP
ncbi:MAG TPA: hypothetical protein HA348_07395 [Thermoplasmata archaeon]|nr:hypothetical protein [Thermoplasmata archaeon]